jgi:hypothetical protein
MGALELIWRNALFSDSVDWDAVHQQAQDAVTHACGYANVGNLRNPGMPSFRALLLVRVLAAGGSGAGGRRGSWPAVVRRPLTARCPMQVRYIPVMP